MIISLHIKPKNGRTTGIEYHALLQRLLAGRSTQGITPVPYRRVWSLQVNQTGLREMWKDSQTYYMQRRCRRPPYSRVEWARGQSGPCE